MKKSYLLLCLLCCLVSCQKKFDNKPVYLNAKNDLETNHLYGNVKEVVRNVAYYQHGSKNEFEDSKLLSTYSFNKAGNYNTYNLYDTYGELEEEKTYVYNEKNKLTELKAIVNNQIKPEEVIQYNSFESDSLLVYTKILKNNVVLNEAYMEYDANGSISGVKKIIDNDTTLIISKNTYDKQKRLVKIEETKSGENQKTMYTYVYDGLGNQITNTMKLPFLDVKNEFKYDGNVLVSVISYETPISGEEEISSYIEYDEYGNTILYKRYEDGKLASINKNEYEFDNHGNWIKRTEYVNSDPAKKNEFMLLLLETRTITYWE